jgi:hypothetical protein
MLCRKYFCGGLNEADCGSNATPMRRPHARKNATTRSTTAQSFDVNTHSTQLHHVGQDLEAIAGLAALVPTDFPAT